jgi:hypothetical protein
VPGVAAGSCNIDEAAELAIPEQPLSPATRAQLAAQLVAAREAAFRYPTVADAQRAHMILAGGFGPLVGAHYLSLGGSMGAFDPSQPGSYIYDGTSPTSKIIDLMYVSSDGHLTYRGVSRQSTAVPYISPSGSRMSSSRSPSGPLK